jgi:hypothetical protein
MKRKPSVPDMQEVEREFKEAGEVLRALDDEIARISVEPNDPQSLNRALREMEQTVDRTVARHGHNELVKTIAEKARLTFEHELREATRKKASS